MPTKERWRGTQRQVPSSIIFRGDRYQLNRKYPALSQADAHAEYLKRSRQVARQPYKGKRPPFKELRTVVKRVVCGKGRVWFAVYIREVS